ncbi:MAG: hypothetical protein LBE27_01995 [Deltaproteobacteria bacterium]|nr:hypothetical protein [Deltaproteobacteria bacterium]
MGIVALTSTALGIIYATFIINHPEIFFKVPLIIVWGFLTILLSRWAIKLGAMRSPLKAAILVFLGSLVGYYVHFAFYTTIVSEGNIIPGVNEHSVSATLGFFAIDPFMELLTSPGELLDKIREDYVFGVPRKDGSTEPGSLYGIIWLVEFILYETLQVVIAYRAAGEPYEEDMQEWLLKQKLATPYVPLPENPKEVNSLFSRIAEGDISIFLTAQAYKRLKGSFLGLDIYFCDGAPDACVTVKHHVKTVKRSSQSVLVEYLMIPEVQAERIMKRLA